MPILLRILVHSLACVLLSCQPGRAPTARLAAPWPPTAPPPEPVTMTPVPSQHLDEEPASAEVGARRRNPREFRVAHVFVALCDNKNQGIVPVPGVVGNGQDPEHNLYWGASFGVKTFFRRSPHWVEIDGVALPPRTGVLRRVVFKARGALPAVYVVADAYDGAHMKDALANFFEAAAGDNENDVEADGRNLEAGGLADLVAFVGHNGLMDMDLSTVSPKAPPGAGDRPGSAVVLACLSHKYFAAPLASASCPPLITTSSLMAPEAYSLDAILRSWAAGDPPKVTRNKAGDAYASYQRIAAGAGRGVFVAGP